MSSGLAYLKKRTPTTPLDTPYPGPWQSQVSCPSAHLPFAECHLCGLSQFQASVTCTDLLAPDQCHLHGLSQHEAFQLTSQGTLQLLLTQVCACVWVALSFWGFSSLLLGSDGSRTALSLPFFTLHLPMLSNRSFPLLSHLQPPWLRLWLGSHSIGIFLDM